MKRSDLDFYLRRLEQHPKRSLGQNFMVDKNLAAFLVRQLQLEGGELVVEIGPGLGALTEQLVEAGCEEIIALEKDRGLCTFLRERFSDRGVEVVEGDALEFDLRNLFRGKPVVLLGNLPYNVSTALITKFLAPTSPVQRAVVTVQREVAERMTAKPHSGEYGAYTVLLQRWWKVEFLRAIPPEVFHPRPNIASAAVSLRRLKAKEIFRCDGTVLERVVRAGFRERRKQLRKLLPEAQEQWEEIATRLACSPTARAEELSPLQWQQLAALLGRAVVDHSPPGSTEIFDVVDEEDQVVDSVARDEVHQHYLRHRAVHILLFNESGELFLQQRAPWKEINPWVWDSSAAGHLEAGEAYEPAAHRELLEELGVDAPLEKIGKLRPCQETGNEFIEVFRGRHEGPFVLAGLELTGGEFFPLQQVRQWAAARPGDFSPVFLLCLELLDR